jgi:hypothetical protein
MFFIMNHIDPVTPGELLLEVNRNRDRLYSDGGETGTGFIQMSRQAAFQQRSGEYLLLKAPEFSENRLEAPNGARVVEKCSIPDTTSPGTSRWI